MLIVAIWLFISTDSHAANILLVPMNCNSHLTFFSRLGIDLAKLGHVTTVLAPSSGRVPDFGADNMENFTYFRYPVNGETPFLNSPEVSEKVLAMATMKSFLQYMLLMRELQMDTVRNAQTPSSGFV